MRIILLRPPRYLWPFNSESSAFWQPLGLLCLAAWLRRERPDWRIEVWDCPAGKCGWKSLEIRAGKERIDILGIGEEAVSAHEALRAAKFVKKLWPQCLVAAGGVYFSHAARQALESGVVDAVVHGEGEETFLELLDSASSPYKWKDIAGLSLLAGSGEIVSTGARPLVSDLDLLPFPAYDLVDMAAYGRSSRNHPGLVSIEHSRGCIDSCNFCVLWKHMGRPAVPGGETRPSWRSKSPERSFEELTRLFRDFGRRSFGWVDPTFNASPEWSDRWSELMLGSGFAVKSGLPQTLHTAWLRADFVVRDQELGILEKLVRSGLRQVMIGVERTDQAGLEALGKHHNDPEITRKAFEIFRTKYPEVYTIGTVIYGLPGDGEAEILGLARSQYELGMDYCFLIPLTPNPGTAFEAAPAALAASTALVGRKANTPVDPPTLASHNFHTPVLPTHSLSLRQLEAAYWKAMLRPSAEWISHTLKHTLFERDPRKKRVHLSLMRHGARTAIAHLLARLSGQGGKGPLLHFRKPEWYDS